MNVRIPEANWSNELQEFTLRNAGRLTILEENDPDIGAQREEAGIQLRGVAFDPRDHSVAIMLGTLAGTEQHLTHVVQGVSVIDVLKTSAGRDLALRLGRGDRQTLLRFSSA